MAFEFRIHHDLALVYKKVTGRYHDAESRASHIEWDEICRSDPRIGEYNEFQDLTGVTDYGVSLNQIRLLADRYEEEWRTGDHQPKRLAYVVPGPLAFGTGRVYGSLMSMTGINFRVFNDRAEAGQWLGLTDEVLAGVLADSGID